MEDTWEPVSLRWLWSGLSPEPRIQFPRIHAYRTQLSGLLWCRALGLLTGLPCATAWEPRVVVVPAWAGQVSSAGAALVFSSWGSAAHF